MTLSVEIDQFRYHDVRDEQQLAHIRFILQDGDILWVRAATGAGKTTLLKILSGVLPTFEPCAYKGQVRLDGEILDAERAKRLVAFCLQLPEYQFLFDSVRRQFSMKPGDAGGGEALHMLCLRLGIAPLLGASIKDISTGQRKLVAIAAALHKQRRLRLFDEPTANLDSAAVAKALHVIQQSATDCITVIASHDERVRGICTQVLSSHDGKAWISGLPEANQVEDRFFRASPKPSEGQVQQELVFHCEDIAYTYPNGLPGLRSISFSLFRGERVGISGDNGSGKTTLIRMLTRDIKPSHGRIVVERLGKCGVIFQESERQLFGSTVVDEILLGVPQRTSAYQDAQAILEKLGLSHRLAMHPLFLSGGEKKKLLIAAVLICQPDTIILDEPFAGMDVESITQTTHLLEEYQRRTQMTVLIVDHRFKHTSGFFERELVIA